MPDTITELGNGAFSGERRSFWFSSLERVEFSKSLSKIEDYAFSGCENLKYIEIPENVTEIGADAFSGCEKLNIEIPDNITKIGSGAFSRCHAIESITIPKSVKTIDECAFGGWSSKQTIKCEATEAGENWNRFWNYSYVGGGGYSKSSCSIIWGYQDNNT